jgi:hypothetical protein
MLKADNIIGCMRCINRYSFEVFIYYIVWSNNCFCELIQIDQGNSNYKITVASDKDYQLLAYGQWFSLGTTASSTTKTGRHNIAEILLKVALNTINQ